MDGDNVSYVNYDYGDVYMYPGYDFERALYLYIWEIMVIVTSIFNLVIIFVLLRRKMRNSTNIILVCIAVSDSLTGLVTLPTYIMVFQRFDPLEEFQDNYNYYSNINGTRDVNSSFLLRDYGNYHYDVSAQDPVDGYILTKDLCNGFMITKYFLSKYCHTVSIFLTLFLGIQRYVSVAFPYKSQFLFNMKRTFVICVLIFVVSPVLHSYHLGDDKAVNGLCQWELQERGCGGVCIYLWIAFFLRHFLPCVTLVVFSMMFISQLHVGEQSLRRMDSNQSQISRRVEENRRISIIVTCIVVVFLVPEIPYSVFLLYNAIDKALNDGRGINIETNRAIQMAYEVSLVISFHANFYIYTAFNRRFRKLLYRTVVKPIRRILGDHRRLSITKTSTASHQGSTRKTTMTHSKTIDSKIHIDTNWTRSNESEKMLSVEIMNLETFKAETRTSENEIEPLNEIV